MDFANPAAPQVRRLPFSLSITAYACFRSILAAAMRISPNSMRQFRQK